VRCSDAVVALALLSGACADQPLPPDRVDAVLHDTAVQVRAPDLALAVGDHVRFLRAFCYYRFAARCPYERVGSGVVTRVLADHQAIVRLDRFGDVEPDDRVDLLPWTATSN
jgi:hypothetical protein